jgi:hypothetical protein
VWTMDIIAAPDTRIQVKMGPSETK